MTDPRAACSQLADRDFMYPTNHDGAGIKRAKDICRHRCTVQDACLKAVLDYEASTPDYGRHGIWAATTPAERHKISQRR